GGHRPGLGVPGWLAGVGAGPVERRPSPRGARARWPGRAAPTAAPDGHRREVPGKRLPRAAGGARGRAGAGGTAPRRPPGRRRDHAAVSGLSGRGVDFAFTAEQDELIRTLRGFARKELAARSQHWDKTGEFPASAWRQMGELGLLGLRAPAEYGGQEADLLTTGIAMEEIARGDFSCTYALQLAGLAGEIIGKNGADDVKKRWLPGIVSGETVVAIALTEPSVGSDAANLVCRAVRDGDEYVITGEKSGISMGMFAHVVMLFARTDATKARGVTAFAVPLDVPGVSRSQLRDLGSRSIGRAVLSFDHVRIPVSHRLGEEGTGFYQVMR